MQEDTTYYIWEYLFRCKIPRMQTTSPTYIKLFGTPTTGNTEYDRDLNNELIETYISIAKMIEYYKDGIPVYIILQGDVKKIYEHIENHIYAWKKRLENGINIGDAPVEDLILMDKFANTIYSEAKYQFTQEIADSILMRHITKVTGINKHNFIQAPDAPETITVNKDETEVEEDKYPKRVSLEDVFKDTRKTLRKWR